MFNYIEKEIKTKKEYTVKYHVIKDIAISRAADGSITTYATVMSYFDLEKIYEGDYVPPHRFAYVINSTPTSYLEPQIYQELENILVTDSNSVLFGGTINILKPTEITLENSKIYKWEQIKRKRTEIINSPIVTPYGTVQCESEDRQNLTDAIMMAQVLASRTESTVIAWTMLDNTVVDLDLEMLTNIGLLIGAKIQNAHQISRTLRQALDSAQTVEEVEAVVWPS